MSDRDNENEATTACHERRETWLATFSAAITQATVNAAAIASRSALDGDVGAFERAVGVLERLAELGCVFMPSAYRESLRGMAVDMTEASYCKCDGDDSSVDMTMADKAIEIWRMSFSLKG